ncbi:MAG TPA: helix-turn-helix transcriptional regulator [Solirubrobacterales bacterium]|nr:helix-turn-helix transcriptional regulator [Solirubrobacterales bacterium]
MTFKAAFAGNLKRYRKRAGLSQEDLATLASVSRDTINKYERRVHVPTLVALVKVAGALQVPPADLLDGITYRPGFTGAGEGRFETGAIS